MQLCDKDLYRLLKSGEIMFVGAEERFPFVPEKQVQPASIDLRLGNRITKFKENTAEFDLKEIEKINQYLVSEFLKESEPFQINPHEIIFSQIYEQMSIGNNVSARIEGRSRMARLGLSIHTTGDYINPGFVGAMPLQIINNNNFPIIMYPYMSICQIMIYQLTDEPLVKYADKSTLPWNKYQNEEYASPSIISVDPVAEIKDYGLIMEKKINLLIENYNKQMEYEGLDIKKVKNISKITEQYIDNINYMEVNMRDQYNANQVGNQGPKAGEKSTINQVYGRDLEIINYSEWLAETQKIKKFLYDGERNEENEILIGELTKIQQAAKESNSNKIKEILKGCGKQVYDISKRIGCSLIAGYISNQLGL